MISFDGIPFKVLSPDGRLPMPSPEDEETGIDYYVAEIEINNPTDYAALRLLKSSITLRPAFGIQGGGSAMIDSGAGSKTLIYPDGGTEVTTDAILMGWRARTLLGAQDSYRVEVKWLLVEAPA